MNKCTYSHSKILTLIATLFCLLHTPVYGYLWSVDSWQKNNQKVLVLGDNHVSCAADARDKKILTNLFTACAEHQNSTHVLFEHTPYTPHLLTDEDKKLFDQYTHKDYMPLNDYISQYALLCNYTYKSLKFSKSDLRYLSEPFKFLTVVRMALYQYLKQKIKNQSTILTQEQKAELLSSINPMFDSTPQDDCSYQDIAIALDTLISYCAYIQAFSSNGAFNELITQLSDKIEHFKNQLQDFSVRYSTFPVLASVHAYIEASNTPHDLELLLELYKPLIGEITDLGFIKELLDTLIKSNSIIVYTGAWHSTAINQALQALGFTCIDTLVDLPQEATTAIEQKLLTITEEFVR